MLKKMVMLSLVALVLLSAGCDRKSVEDVYPIVDGGNNEKVNNSKSLSALEAYEQGITESSKYVYDDPGYSLWSSDELPELVAQGDVCTTTIRGTKSNTTLSFCVKDSMVADYISDICELTSEENYLNLRSYLLNVDKNNLIDEQGNINNSFRDVPSKVIFIKIDIKNEDDEIQKFYSTNLKLYSVDRDNNKLRYKLIENNDETCIDCPDEWTLKGSSCITLQPKESKEVVIAYFVEDVWVQHYTGRYENMQLGDEVPFNDIYLTTHFMDTGKSDYYKQGFEENKSLLKLELRKK